MDLVGGLGEHVGGSAFVSVAVVGIEDGGFGGFRGARATTFCCCGDGCAFRDILGGGVVLSCN